MLDIIVGDENSESRLQFEPEPPLRLRKIMDECQILIANTLAVKAAVRESQGYLALISAIFKLSQMA